MAMEDSNTAQETTGRAIVSLPTVIIPQDYQQHKYGYPEFQVETAEGNITVIAYGHTFECKGSVGALTEHGLIQPDWLPGIPGNNSTRQTVVFEEGIPRLLKGRPRGPRNTAPHIVIMRLSRCTYCVSVPTTKEQEEFIHLLVERRKREMREQNRPVEKPISPEDSIHVCLSFIEVPLVMHEGNLAKAGYHYTQESMTRIDVAFRELSRALTDGVLVQDNPVLQRDGNVIHLNFQPVKLSTRA